MAKKLKDVPDVLDPSLPYESSETKDAVEYLLESLKKGVTFVVVDAEQASVTTSEPTPVAAPVTPSESAPVAATETVTAVSESDQSTESEPLELTKKRRGRKPKAEGDQKSVTRPREKKSRVWAVGVVLKKHGLDVPLTEELAKEVDAICGNENTKESMAWLQTGWHILNGFTGTFSPEK